MIIDIQSVPQASAAVIDPMIPELAIGLVRAGPKGLKGDRGWSPVFAIVEDGSRRVQQLVDWVGGEGSPPAALTGLYVGETGLVDVIDDAVDIRGGQGLQGVSVTSAAINGSYHLILSLSNGSNIDAGYVRGPTGAAATVAAGATTTVAYGQPATVTNSGTTSAAVFNFQIPEGAPGPGGTVTSVALSVPTGLQVSGSPITTSGTFAVTWASGYQAYTAAEASKLSGIASGATANQTDSYLLNRANHTGTQLAATISDFSTAADARISAAVGTSVQAYNAKLAALAGQTWAADRFTYYTSASVAAIGTITSFGRSLVDDTDASAARGTLGVVIGTDVQAYNAKLAALASLTGAADKLPYFTGASSMTTADLTSFARTLLAASDQAGAQIVLGISGGGTGLVPLGSMTTVSSPVAAIAFTLPSGYKEYVLKFWDILPSNISAAVRLRTSTNGGSSWSGTASYSTTLATLKSSTSTFAISNAASNGYIPISDLIAGNGTTNARGISGEVRIINPSAARYSQLIGETISIGTSSELLRSTFAGETLSSADVDAVQIIMDTGNIQSGFAQLYGVVTV